MEAITVLTITRKRPHLLERAMQALAAQTYKGKLIHKIFIDNCEETRAYLERSFTQTDTLMWYYCEREEHEDSGPVRLAKLRSYAIHNVETDYFSFMDDDIEFLPQHYEKLVSSIKKENCQAVYCDMGLYYPNGEAYLEHAFPWERNNKEKAYWEYVGLGILKPGSNVKIQRPGVSIDTNTWLFHKSIFSNSFQINDEFSYDDWEANIAEDEKIMYWLMENRIDIRPTHDVTVKYYLGGYSNTFSQDTAITDVWTPTNIIESKKICIITCTLNRPSLEAACRSVDEQTYHNWHHYVIGDGVLPLDVENEKRSVFGFSRAHGALEPSANMPNGTQNPLQRWALKHLNLYDYVCFLDDDNVYDKRFLEVMVRTLEAHKDVGIALCAADDHRYHQRMDGFPVIGRCDNSAFLLRSSIAGIIDFPYASMEKDCVQDCEFIIKCAEQYGWVNVPEKLLHYGVSDNYPPERGKILFLEGWKKPQRAYQLAFNGNYTQALELFQDALTEVPFDAWSIWKIAELYLLLGDEEAANSYFLAWKRMYQESGYQNYATTVNLGIYNKHVGKPFTNYIEDGIQQLTAIQKNEPEVREHDYILGLYYAYLDNKNLAKKHIEKANLINDDRDFWAINELKWQFRVYKNDFAFNVSDLETLL